MICLFKFTSFHGKDCNDRLHKVSGVGYAHDI